MSAALLKDAVVPEASENASSETVALSLYMLRALLDRTTLPPTAVSGVRGLANGGAPAPVPGELCPKRPPVLGLGGGVLYRDAMATARRLH